MFLSGLIADKQGSYVPAFYIAGSEVLLGALIIALLFCLKSPLQQTEGKAELVSLTTPHRRNSEDMEVEFKTLRLVVELYQGNPAESLSIVSSDNHIDTQTVEDRTTDV